MSYLIDTNAWIGYLQGNESFGTDARQVMTYQNWECAISIASVWEAAIKTGLGKLRLGYDLREELPKILEDNGFRLLPIDFADAAYVMDLPNIHRDPFDRLQVVQCQRRTWPIISRDAVFEEYGLTRIW